MVDSSIDPKVFTAQLIRSAKDNEARLAAEPEPEVTADGVLEAEPLAVETVAVESVPAASAPDADAAFRRGRLGVVAAIVLILLFVWIRQRRK